MKKLSVSVWFLLYSSSRIPTLVNAFVPATCLTSINHCAFNNRSLPFSSRIRYNPSSSSSSSSPLSVQSSKNNDDSRNTNDKNENKSIWNGITELWDEIIEVSTYGPSERKMLKAQRERQQQQHQFNSSMQADSFDSFPSSTSPTSTSNDMKDIFDDDNDKAWINAFQSAKSRINDNGEEESPPLEYDGYALQDLLMKKWGAPLDIDFQSMSSTLYCTILPMVGYGSPLRSRHDSELNYLMHLQGVVEILHKYDNLERFVMFVEETDKVPKRGTDSVPFRLDLKEEDMEKILKFRNGLV